MFGINLHSDDQNVSIRKMINIEEARMENLVNKQARQQQESELKRQQRETAENLLAQRYFGKKNREHKTFNL